MSQTSLHQSPLHKQHLDLKAKMVPFAGWEMPIQYQSIIKEHLAVRNEVGIFDVSHMGEFIFSGTDTIPFLNHLISNDLSAIPIGHGLYSGMLYDNGTFVDDVIVYVLAKDKALMIVNASNIAKDFQWIKTQIDTSEFEVSLTDESQKYGLIAIQGPKVENYIKPIFPNHNLDTAFNVFEYPYQDEIIMIANTGYTGEKGVEICAPHKSIRDIFAKCIDSNVTPCGLGARDSLRLEKGYSLYGHEINDQVTPVESGLMWTVKMNKDFIGKESILALQEKGATQKLVGFIVQEKRGIAREGATVYAKTETLSAPTISATEGEQPSQVIGKVTSGTHSPALGKNIGLAYIDSGYKEKQFYLKIRDNFFLADKNKRVFV